MRNRNNRLSLAMLLASAMTAGACSCNDDGAGNLEGDLEILDVRNDVDGPADFLIDFGQIALNGEPGRKDLELRNIGSAALTIEALAVDAPFEVTPSDAFTLPISGKGTLVFHFRPVEAGTYEFVATVATSEGRKTFRLVGEGVTPLITCTPATLDFGSVEVEVNDTRNVTCTNQTDLPLPLVATAVSGNSAEFFEVEGLSATSPTGVMVPPGVSLPIPVKFTNTGSIGRRTANFTLNSGNVVVQRVELRAESIANAIVVEPAPLEFGYVPLSATAERPLTVRNIGSRSVTLQAPRMLTGPGLSNDFTLVGAAVLQIDAGAEAQVTVKFAPLTTGDHDGKVVLANNGTSGKVVHADVRGKGGGPIITCSPNNLDFGVLAVGMTRMREFVCTNIGEDDPDEATADNLFVTAAVSGMPEIFTTRIVNSDGGAGPDTGNGYASGEWFTVEVTYAPGQTSMDSTNITVLSNDGLRPEYPLVVAGEGRALEPCNATLSPLPRLNFHRVAPGGEATQQFAVINNDDHECIISNMRVINDGEEVFTINAIDTITLPGRDAEGGGELRFPVTYSPPASANQETATVFTGKVVFDISDPANPTREMPLAGSSQKPCAEIIPSHVDFGTTAPGCNTSERPLRIRNICSTPFQIDRVEMNVGPSCAGTNEPGCEFGFRSFPSSTVTIPDGGEETFNMVYKPLDIGEDLGSVLVYLVGVDEPYVATLQGRARHDARHTDVFSQKDRPKVDLLWVIDNSGSMMDEQTAIGANLGFFLDFAIAEQIDFQLGVTSTDTDCGTSPTEHCGRLNPWNDPDRRNRILNANSSNLSSKWINAVRTGTGGSASEMGLLAAKQALSPGMIDSVGHIVAHDGNAGFLRKDAALSIIFVSDEKDHSPGPTNDYLTFFRSIKGSRNSNMLKMHGIIIDPFVPSCDGSYLGDRYFAMIDATDGGVWASICNTNWQATLKEIGKNAFGFSSRFFLTGTPACAGVVCTGSGPDAEIVVEVDGSRYPPTFEGGWVWRYDRTANALDFNPFHVPNAGAQVSITYTVMCE